MGETDLSMTDAIAMRCPFCLAKFMVEGTDSASALKSCERCSRNFYIRDARPFREHPDIALHSEERDQGTDEWTKEWALGYMGVLAAIVLVSHFIHRNWNGPDFLMFYFGLFLLLFISSTLLRWLVGDSWFVSVVAAVAFWGVGLGRYIFGSKHSMENWGNLIWAMVV